MRAATERAVTTRVQKNPVPHAGKNGAAAGAPPPPLLLASRRAGARPPTILSLPRPNPPATPAEPKLTALLKPYAPLILTIVVLTIAANSLNLIVPKMIARAIDTFATSQLVLGTLVVEFLAVAIGIFFFTYLQNIAQTYASERVARDLRTKLVAKLATQDLAYIQRTTTATLLTNLTSDVDAVKLFVSQAVGSLVSSVFLIIGASVLLPRSTGSSGSPSSRSSRSSGSRSRWCSAASGSSSPRRSRRSTG